MNEVAIAIYHLSDLVSELAQEIRGLRQDLMIRATPTVIPTSPTGEPVIRQWVR